MNQIQGLTSAQVRAKHEAGESNRVDDATSRPLSQILRANIFTLFNGILAAAAVIVLAVGEPQDAVFALVLILNAAIGVVSEVRSKRTLDSLAVLHAPTVRVHRDSQTDLEIPAADLVTEDVVSLRLGDQIPADGEILAARGLEVDESALTGESLPIVKAPGDPVLSGTAVVAGSGEMLVRVVGEEAWARKVTREAKRFSLAVSEIQQSVNKILKWISWLLPIVAVLLTWSQMNAEGITWQMALVLAVSGIIGMIPQGLVLLTSMNFALAAAKLARRGVLVQELPAVEILARVDMLCLDKTGTITSGKIRGHGIFYVPETDEAAAACALHYLTADPQNETSRIIFEMVGEAALAAPEGGPAAANWQDWKQVAFNSARKWSALRSDDGQMWALGAPEILGERVADEGQRRWLTELVADQSAEGRRVVCLAWGQASPGDPAARDNRTLPATLQVQAACVLEEEVRSDAAQTLEYFRSQGVKVKVISGDSPGTVAAISQEVGLRSPNGAAPVVVDARHLPEIGTPAFAEAVQQADVFGRVSPEQKQGIVVALQQAGHTVAMTGDGVNDALALKTADLGIAMGAGASATKAVSRLILTDGKFSVLPNVVAEGRRIIANMERVSSLFLAKTTYALLIAFVVSFAGLVYPLLPRHLTYIGWFTIGIPSFFLALAPNSRRYVKGFLRRTLALSIPAGLVLGVGALAAYLVIGNASEAGQSGATIAIIVVGLWLLGITARPFNWWRLVLLAAMAWGAVAVLAIEPIREFFALEIPGRAEWGIIAVIVVVGAGLIELAYWLRPRLLRSLKVEVPAPSKTASPASEE